MPDLRGIIMNNHVLINYGKDLNYPEKSKLLVSGTVKSIFPFNIIKENKIKKGITNVKGYIRFRDLKNMNLEEILNLIILLTQAYDEIRKYPVFIEEMVITFDTTFVNKEFSDVRFLYVPSHREESEAKSFNYLLHLLKSKTEETNEVIIDTIITYIENNGLNTEKTRELISDIKFEMQ